MTQACKVIASSGSKESEWSFLYPGIVEETQMGMFTWSTTMMPGQDGIQLEASVAN
jgi:hypothetical protein